MSFSLHALTRQNVERNRLSDFQFPDFKGRFSSEFEIFCQRQTKRFTAFAEKNVNSSSEFFVSSAIFIYFSPKKITFTNQSRKRGGGRWFSKISEKHFRLESFHHFWSTTHRVADFQHFHAESFFFYFKTKFFSTKSLFGDHNRFPPSKESSSKISS